MMQREVIAVVLCILAQAANAEITCVAPSAQDAGARPAVSSDTARVAAAPHAQQQQQPAARAELIKTAAASTRDDVPPAATVHSGVNGQQDHPRRGGTAMLLAALALMSGIALRRYGARGL